MGWIDTAVVAQFHSVRYRPQTAAWSLDVLRKTNIDHLYRYISCQQRKYVYVSIYHKTSNRSYARYAARVPERRNAHDQTNIPAGGYSSKTPVTNLLGTRYEFESVQAVRTTLHHTQKLICLNGKPPPPSIGGVVQLPSKVPLYGCTRISCVTKRILGAYETMDKSATIMTALAGEEDSITRTFPTALHHYASSRGHL